MQVSQSSCLERGAVGGSALRGDSASRLHFRLSEIVSALSYSLDLTEGQPMGHAIKCCVLGMKLAQQLGLSSAERSQLYYALLLKDSGCSSNAARVYQIFGSDDRATKRNLKTTDWTRAMEGLRYVRQNAAVGQSLFERYSRIVRIACKGSADALDLVQTRCHRGAAIARDLGFSEITAEAIYSLDEHWNGRGQPRGLVGEEIPLFSRILSMCQTLDVFATAADPATAFQVLEERSGRWFDPQLVRAMRPLQFDREIWESRTPERARALAMQLEPPSNTVTADERCLTTVCEGFAGIIDAKSPWTHLHSRGVAMAAVGIARSLGLPATDVVNIERAALLHDIGKLSLSNAILDKPGKLTDVEFAEVQRHPYFTQRILEKISTFEDITFIASAHHEKLDGSGYFRNLSGDALTLPARILAIADIYDALSTARPYRDALAPEAVLSIIARDVPHALCPVAFDGLKMWMDRTNPVRVAA